MKGKGSYRHKFAARNIEAGKPALPLVYANDEKRKEFEAGKVLLIDKPLHWTSFDVVRKIRNAIRIKKVGHAGTLDPLASGLLIVCTGSATKKINEYMGMEKEYTGSFTLGAITPTYDLESEPESFGDYSAINLQRLQEAGLSFIGEQMQKPPVYSAIKKEGTPLYELARRGKEVDPEPRRIFISSFSIVSYEAPVVNFLVTCSTGTYIRSLAHDFGQSLGCGAYLSRLRRTRIGNYSAADALTLESFLMTLSDTADQNG